MDFLSFIVTKYQFIIPIAMLFYKINSVDIHWYQRQGDDHWKLVSNRSEENYRISQADRGGSVMAVMVVATSDGDVKRVSSNVIGPIR